MKALLTAQQINKSDRDDARGIAQMMRVGLFKPVHVKTLAAQEQRMLLTSRKLLQRKLLDIECDMRGTLRNFGLKVGVISTAGYEARIRHLVEGFPKLAAIVEPLLTVRRVMRQQLATLHKMLLDTVRHDPVCRRFMTVPGVGPVVALTYRASVDQPHRFVHSRAVGAHAGLTPKRHQSGEIDYDGGVSKCGDAMLRTMLYEAAQSMLTHSKKWSWLKAWAMRVAQRGACGAPSSRSPGGWPSSCTACGLMVPTSVGPTAPRASYRQSDGTASLKRRSTGSASAGRCPLGDDGWREFAMTADPAALVARALGRLNHTILLTPS
jgi:transposase